MSKVEVIYSDEDNFCQYPSQYDPQRSYVGFNCSTNELYSSYSSEIGNSTSMDCFHNKEFRWWISPWMKLSAINSLLEEIEPLAQKVQDGYSEEYNGNNYVGVLSEEAEEYTRKIESLCDAYSSDPDNLFTKWRWSELVEDRSIEELADHNLFSDKELSKEEAVKNAYALGVYLWSAHQMEVLPINITEEVVWLRARPLRGDEYVAYEFKYSEEEVSTDESFTEEANPKELMEELLELVQSAFEWIDMVPGEDLSDKPFWDFWVDRKWVDEFLTKVKKYLKK